MPVDNEQANSSDPVKDRRLHLQVSTLMLLVVCCGTLLAYCKARWDRHLLTAKLNAVRPGTPAVGDVTQYGTERFPFQPDSLALWVPHGGQIKLCWATQRIGDRFPEHHRSLELGEGPHVVTFSDSPRQTLLEVNQRVVFNQEHTSTWNLQRPIAWRQTGPETLKPGRTVLLTAQGVATLRADEQYNADLHQFGLLIWVER